jgi:AraC-like DNA-binding protein
MNHFSAIHPAQHFAAPTDFTLPLVRRERLASRDLAEVHSHMQSTICSHDLGLEVPSSIDFTHRQASIGELALNAIYYGQHSGRVWVKAAPVQSRYLVQFSLSGSSRISQCGKTTEVAAGSVFILNPAYEHEQELSQDYRHMNVLLPCSILQRIAYRDLYLDLDQPILFESCDIASNPGAATLWRYVATLCADLDSDSPVMAHPRVAASIEDSFGRLLLASIPNSLSPYFDAAAQAPAPFYVRRAEEFIRQHAAEEIGLSDIVEAAGVSTRTLHAGFKTYREVTPMGHLKAQRLDLARQRLQQARDKGWSVTDVAYDCGMTHLSKFARDYQKRFGETPSETRRRGA